MGASRTNRPLAAHPAFPALVALWFAALLGLGTFVVPPANFEGLVVASGLSDLVPAATPPLGDTARIAISAIAALLGALLGFAIAARIRRNENAAQPVGEIDPAAADPPWLSDEDAEVDHGRVDGTTMEPAPLDDFVADEAPASIRSRLARRRSTTEHYEPPVEAVAEVAEEDIAGQPVPILQASELPVASAEEEAIALDEADTPSNDDEDNDLQRFAADRLVAGLPRLQRRNFDDDPLEDWSQPEPAGEAAQTGDEDGSDFAAWPEPGAAPGAEDAQDSKPAEPDFDGPGLVEEAEYEELPADPAPPEPAFEQNLEPVETREWTPADDGSVPGIFAADDGAGEIEPSAEPTPEPNPEPTTETPVAPANFTDSSLSELVARFDRAVAAQRSGSAPAAPEGFEPQPDPAYAPESDDPVIAFLRREADRDRGEPGEPRSERQNDPRAVLRNALDKLDRVSRKS